MQVALVCATDISAQFTLKMCFAAQNREILLKPFFWGFKVFQSHWCW